MVGADGSTTGTTGTTGTTAAPARDRWESRTEWPLIVASGAFLVAYSWTVLDQTTPPALQSALSTSLAIVWVAFALDYAVRLVLTPKHGHLAFLRGSLSDLLSVVVPIARPFRLLKNLRRLPWFSGRGGAPIRSRIIVYGLSYAVMYVYVIALTVLAVERTAPNATIVSFGDAVWWACVTIATVGYGDFAPVTVVGRMLAVLLMAGGVAIIGTASATIVSYLSERIAASHAEHDRGHGARQEHPGDPRDPR
ncbi:potassium channel family protein [Plantibacter sp. YIM 135347]|uniref:potassium channel family protein n=1 Tax=Plantibacter sp. YIM 135347 TaxID=3423919 RepID=UPI003D3321AA